MKKLFPAYIWSLPPDDNAVYLTFDDGPHPEITPWVMNLLEQYNAHASFFCIGQRVEQYPEIYQQIIDRGHATGNHSFHHVNGWKTETELYCADVALASKLIDSNLFRPPYGRISSKQAEGIADALNKPDACIIMWDVLSADFDRSFSPEQCAAHVTKHVRAGSIVVFHDSDKAFPNLKTTLPAVLEFLKEKKYELRRIESQIWKG